MCRFFVLSASALVAFASSNAIAQQVIAAPTASFSTNTSTGGVSLREAVQTALDNSPELSAARQEVEATLGSRIQAGVLPNPTLTTEIEDLRRENRTTTILFNQPIELGGKRRARIAAAERATDLARVQFEGRQADLKADVRAAFFAALISQERVQLAQRSLELARTGSVAAANRVTAGKVSPVEETKAKVAEAGVRLELIQAKGELKANLQLLQTLMARPTGIARVDGNALAMPNLLQLDLVEQQLPNAPALRQSRLSVQRLTALAELEQAKRIPDVVVTAGGVRDGSTGRNRAVVGISIPIPVFDMNRGNIVEALRRLDKAQDELRAFELRLRADVVAARQRYETAGAEVETLEREILPGAQTAFEAATQGFELGKFSFLEVLDAQRTLLQARAQYLRALAEAHRSISDLDRLLGVSSSQS